MASRQVPVKLTYQKGGTLPPVYVAGTFSSPPWQPFEMEVSQDNDGQNVFSKVINASEGSDIQYKFRIGPGDWWMYNETAEIVKDGQGNINNILRVPSGNPDGDVSEPVDPRVAQIQGTENPTPEVADSAAPLDRDVSELKTPGDQDNKSDSSPLSGKPLEEVSETEAPNTAEALNVDKSTPISGGDGGPADPPHSISPMFSHEYIEVTDDDDGDGDTLEAPGGPQDDFKERKLSDTKQHGYAEDPDIDFDNPMLEKFPSDSASIMATIRRLSTSVDEDRTLPQGVGRSLAVVSPLKSSTNESFDAQNLSVPQAGQSRNGGQRNSLSASGGSFSSLNSIAENDDERPIDGLDGSPREDVVPVVEHPAFVVEQPSPTGPQSGGDNHNDVFGGGVTHQGSASKSDRKEDASASDEDEGIAMCNVSRKKPAEGNLDSTDLISPEPVNSLRLSASHVVDPGSHSSTPRPEEDRFDSAESNNPGNLAINHARAVSPHVVFSSASDNSNQNSLRKNNADRPTSRTSLNSVHEVGSKANWLQFFFRVFLLDWIGGLMSRLWPRRGTQ